MVLTAAFALASCNSVEVQKPGQEALTIVLDCGDYQTRSGETDFETAIDHFDFFFFKDSEGTQPIATAQGRVSGNTTTLSTETAAYAALRDITSYVYIIANFPDAIDHSREWTLAQLLEKDFESSILNSVNDMTGSVTFCSSLVMDSYNPKTGNYTTELTPKAYQEERTVTIGLSRVAAKLTMEITVPEQVDAKEAGEYWTPVIKNLKAYYVNALNSGATLNAAPVHREEGSQATYVTYPDYYPVTRTSTEALVFETDPAYTYPQTWQAGENAEPYFKISMPWMHSVKGSSNFYYKVVVPRPSEGVWTLNRNTWYKVKVNLSVVETAEEYIDLDYGISISPWAESGWTGGSGLSSARFFNVPVTEYEIYSQEDLDIPFSSSSAVKAYFTDISYTHYGTIARPSYQFIYGNETDTDILLPTTDSHNVPVAAAAQDKSPYKLSVEGKSVRFTHQLKDIYTVHKIVLTIENQDGRSENVTILQHPAIELKTLSTRNVFINGHFAKVTEGAHVNGSTQKIGVPYTVKYMGESGTRYHSDDRNISNYWHAPSNPSGTYGESEGYHITKDSSKGRYGVIEGDQNLSVPYMTVVTVSAFNDKNNTYVIKQNGVVQDPKPYRIGDPRITSTSRFSNLYPYLYKPSTLRNEDGTTTEGAAEYRAWEEPLKIMMASTSRSNANVIAPYFLVGSMLNAMPTGNNFDDVLKRAATYQEAGYPAGRWRLPTEAEIMFMIARQEEGSIPHLWGSTSYWCADGRLVKYDATNGSDFRTDISAGFNRFVYDLWYWGDEPMPDDECYYPNMHLVTPNN